MSNSIRHQEQRLFRAKQCQYENRIKRNALRNKGRIPVKPRQELTITKTVTKKKKNRFLGLFDRIFRKKRKEE